jgi:SAM-dependent methyltransferase
MSLALSNVDRWSMRRNRLAALLREKGLQGVIAEIGKRGLSGSLTYASRQIRYSICIELAKQWDRKYSVETGGQIELDQLAVVGPHKASGAPAVSTSPRTFRRLSRYFPQDRTGLAYIDVGAGKGRTLFLASLLGFGRVIGVEFAAELCAKATENVLTFKGLSKPASDFSVVNADATEYEFPIGDLVLYFGNPFGLDLWPAMIANILRNLGEAPRRITLIVAGSQQETIRGAGRLLSERGEFTRVASGKLPYYLDTYLPYYFECFESGLRSPPTCTDKSARSVPLYRRASSIVR